MITALPTRMRGIVNTQYRPDRAARVNPHDDRTVNHQGRPAKFTDEQILDMRILHEQQGWTRLKVARKYGLDLREVHRYLDYLTRSRLVPKVPA